MRRVSIKKFKFKLEGLLRLRTIEEERALGDLARIMIRVNEQEANRDRANRLFRDETNEFEQAHRDDFTIHLFQMYDRYLERLETEADEAGKKLEEIRPELEKEKEKVMVARRNRRVVEILRERAKAQYDKDLRKAEQAELLELNQYQRSFNLIAGEADEQEPIKRELQEVYQFDDEIGDLSESETPEAKTDHVAEYFERMGLGKPPKRT